MLRPPGLHSDDRHTLLVPFSCSVRQFQVDGGTAVLLVTAQHIVKDAQDNDPSIYHAAVVHCHCSDRQGRREEAASVSKSRDSEQHWEATHVKTTVIRV